MVEKKKKPLSIALDQHIRLFLVSTIVTNLQVSMHFSCFIIIARVTRWLQKLM